MHRSRNQLACPCPKEWLGYWGWKLRCLCCLRLELKSKRLCVCLCAAQTNPKRLPRLSLHLQPGGERLRSEVGLELFLG